MNKLLLLGASLCAAGLAVPAGASRRDQAACFMTFGPRAQSPAALGGGGAAACTAALADAKKPVEDAYQRANLIRSRAVHHIAMREYDQAREDLDLSERTVTGPDPDPFWTRSFPVANQMLRAYILLEAGEKDQAIALSRAAASARPYDMDLAETASRLEFAATGDLEAYIDRLRSQARFDPGRIFELYTIALIRRRYDEAVTLYPQILLTVAQGRGGYRANEAAGAADNLVKRAYLTGSMAYALAATGKAKEARALLAEFQQEVERESVEPVEGSRKKWQAVIAVRADIDASAARWRRLVELRLSPGEPATELAVTEMIGSSDRLDPMILDLAQAVRSARPQSAALSEEMLRPLQGHDAQLVAALISFTLQDLLAGLPEVDSDGRQPKYDPGTDSSLLMTESGYMSREGPVSGSRTVKFNTTFGTAGTATELVYMRAAQMAREQRLGGFIVLARRLIQRSVTMGASSYPDGYEAEIDIVTVDPAALPEAYKGAGWRVIDANALWAAQSAFYIDQRRAFRQRREQRRAEQKRGGKQGATEDRPGT